MNNVMITEEIISTQIMRGGQPMLSAENLDSHNRKSCFFKSQNLLACQTGLKSI